MIRRWEIVRSGFRAPLALLLLACACGMVVASGATHDPGSMKVGDFAVLVASRLAGPDVQQSTLTPDAAVEILHRAGVRISKSPAAPLTEGDAAEILGQFHISLSPLDPDNLLDPARASSLVGIFGSTLTARSSASPSLSSRALGTGSAISSGSVSADATSIEDCQALPKTQDCQFCCRDLLGGSNNDSHTNRVCAKACNTKSRNVSPSEPTP